MQVSIKKFLKFNQSSRKKLNFLKFRRGYVPDVILATIELPESDGPSVIGTGTLIQATVCRPKRDLRSESNAKEISDALPFLGKCNKFLT